MSALAKLREQRERIDAEIANIIPTIGEELTKDVRKFAREMEEKYGIEIRELTGQFFAAVDENEDDQWFGFDC